MAHGKVNNPKLKLLINNMTNQTRLQVFITGITNISYQQANGHQQSKPATIIGKRTNKKHQNIPATSVKEKHRQMNINSIA